MKASIIIICDKIRQKKLERLFLSMKEQLNKFDTEILLLHESNENLPAPSLPINVNYINIPAKQGIAFNRNQGIKHAQHDLLIFIDDDCWVQEKWLESILNPFHDPNILATTSGTYIPKSNFSLF